jgi:pimeloyl-ACP methyl ester carboxylesterase
MGRRCGRPDVEATVVTVAGPNGEALWTGSVGTGGSVALLLHQTGRSASCGWWPFANHLAEQGVRAVMLDLCGYGKSTCDPAEPWSTDYADQVARTVARLRQDGATRVTLVGASLGGTVASVSAAPARADAVVNLSGFGFAPMVTAPAIAALTIPVLGAGSHAEESDSAALESQVEVSASPTKRFVWADSGHGWSLVLEGPQPDSPITAVGRTVIAWTMGDFTG